MPDWINVEQTHTPGNTAEVADVVRNAAEQSTPVFPLGGATSLDYGLPATDPGWSLSLAGLNQIVDYPDRDMTITVGSGVTMKSISDALSENGQRLPIDVPNSEQATIGGVVACNWNGPLRYSMGTVRDYVIGIEGVDGRGTVFKGGGRVVKNVAGYDFCKLLTGSLGTLAVITQLTLKVKPVPTESAWVVCPLDSPQQADSLIESLTTSSPVPAAAVELVGGPQWQESLAIQAESAHWLLIALEGSSTELKWMIDSLSNEWAGQHKLSVVQGEQAERIWQALTEFPASGDSALVVGLSVIPSRLVATIDALVEVDSTVRWLSHAASGIIVAHFADFPQIGVSRAVTGQLRTAAAHGQGHVSILRNRDKTEVSRNSVWGAPTALSLMKSVKQQFDPNNILNRGRFVY